MDTIFRKIRTKTRQGQDTDSAVRRRLCHGDIVTNIVINIIYLILGSIIRSKTYFNTSEPISFDFITECLEQRKFPKKYWLGLIPFSTQPGTEYKNYVQILTQSGLSGNC